MTTEAEKREIILAGIIESMNEREITKEAVDNDWAVLPFDEAEDDKRWGLLIEETEKLERDVARFEAAHGENILMNKRLYEIHTETHQTEFGELF